MSQILLITEIMRTFFSHFPCCRKTQIYQSPPREAASLNVDDEPFTLMWQ